VEFTVQCVQLLFFLCGHVHARINSDSCLKTAFQWQVEWHMPYTTTYRQM